MAALLLSHNVGSDIGCRWRRYVCEDRYTAIRWAIAAAQKGDVVIVAGKGDQDWTEVADGRGGSIRVRSFALDSSLPFCTRVQHSCCTNWHCLHSIAVFMVETAFTCVILNIRQCIACIGGGGAVHPPSLAASMASVSQQPVVCNCQGNPLCHAQHAVTILQNV